MQFLIVGHAPFGYLKGADPSECSATRLQSFSVVPPFHSQVALISFLQEFDVHCYDSLHP